MTELDYTDFRIMPILHRVVRATGADTELIQAALRMAYTQGRLDSVSERIEYLRTQRAEHAS